MKIPYDKFSKLKDIKATVYNANGDVIKKLNNSDIRDIALVNFAVYQDIRMKYIDPKILIFPFTIEYSYEKKISGLENYIQWSPFNGYHVSTENSDFKLIIPSVMKLRYLEKNLLKTHTETREQDNILYTWYYDNMPAYQEEEFSLPAFEYLPIVYTAPADFEIGNYKGNSESWDNFGKWVLNLNEGRDQVSDATKEQIKKSVEGISDIKEKIKVVYEYLQNKTRYVAI